MSDLSPSISQLSTQISKHARAIETYLQSNSLPKLSLAEDAYPFFPGTGPTEIDSFPAMPSDVAEARREFRQSCELLLHLVATPSETLLWTITTSHHHSGACLQYVYHFGIADAIPLGDEISFKDLASKVGVDESQCTRILRTLMTQYFFIEKSIGHVSHTAMSKLLTVPSVRDCVGYLIEEGFLGAPRISETAERFAGSEERHHSSWNVAHGKELPIFEFFETDSARMRRFLGNMAAMGGQDAYNIKHLVQGYNWRHLDAGTVVDVGGSIGHVSIAISEVAPQLDFVVQDLEQVVNDMKTRTKVNPNPRVRWEAHNFFQEQPIRGASIYLLRFILHDYSDKYAARILKALVPALGQHSKILLFDGIMPEPNTMTKPDERKAR